MKTAFDTYHQLDYVFANAMGASTDSRSHNIFKKPNYDATYGMIQGVANTVHAAVGYLVAPPGGTSAIDSIEDLIAQDQTSIRDKAIVVCGSGASMVEYDLNPQYGMGKAAINSYVWTNKSRLAKVGIRINCIAPAWVDTPLLAPLVKLGIVLPKHIIPMEAVTDAILRFFDDSAISGIVTSIPIPSPDVKKIDIPATPLDKRFQIVSIASAPSFRPYEIAHNPCLSLPCHCRGLNGLILPGAGIKGVLWSHFRKGGGSSSCCCC
ncbi:hypothetical protein DL93DRAFT_1868032 [Clavulina sp. PMI_390]|nr:hypothetical protein DL93DRAFT_1868032 [Clavulina sp. PMI_390]